MLIDLHTHTYPMSDDSFMSPDEAVAQAKALGLDGICLTEHDAFWPDAQIRDLSRRHDFLVLPGCEINTDAGHVLAFGLCRYQFGMHKPAFLRAAADRAAAVLIAAHPYRRRFLEQPARNPQARDAMLQTALTDPFFTLCDAIESLNGRGSPPQNRYSADLTAALALPATAGSDAHRPAQLGAAATQFQTKIETLADLIAQLKTGQYRPINLRPPPPDTPARSEC